QGVDSLFGLYYRLKFNHYNDFLKRDLALQNIELSIAYYKKANNLKQTALSTMNKGNLFLWQGDNQNALLNYFEALRITEKNKFNYQSGLIYKNIGVVFSNQDKQKEALAYANKALQVFIDLKDDEQIAGAYINVGNCYFNQYDADNALYHYKKAEKISEKSNNLENLSFVYNNIGSVYIEDKKDTLNGLEYIKKAINIRTKQNDLNGLIFCYNNIANIYIGLKKFDLAEENIIKAKQYAIEANNKRELTESFKLLSFLNESKKDYQKALHFHKLYLKQKDSLINEKNNKDVKELDIKYQSEKKEKQILQQQAEVKQKNSWLLLISSFVIIGLIVFNNFRTKSKLQKEQLKLENKLLEEQSNYKIQEQRLDISRELHDNVGSQLTFIISILDNLKSSSVQFDEAIDKKIDTLTNFANKSISELRDTIWVLNSKQLSLSELKSRMLNFMKDAGESVDHIDFQFDFVVSDDKQLTSKQAINLYRILQEIVNNAIKHANAKDISVLISQIENELHIKISDNGIGFDYETKKKKSFGLTNIQNRVQEINGTLKVQSELENGTNYFVAIIL
ncbi:MAG: sensor histidine kinase, partial [Flavobacteriales bacterium]|nr:sensor histidine kinase [Flavobacteriales bacterium]